MDFLLMAIIILSGCIVIKTKIFRNSIYGLICIYLWILLEFNTFSPDSASYEYMYNNLSYYRSHEPGFVLFMKSCSLIGLNYQQFKIIFATLIVVITIMTLRRLTDNKNIVLAMFLIVPTLGYATVIRQALAASIICYSMGDLISVNKKNSVLKFIFGVLIAMLFHYSSIFYFILLFSRFQKFNKSIILMGILGELALFGLISSGYAYKIVSKVINNPKITDWFNYSNIAHPKWSTLFILVACQCILIYMVKYSTQIIITNIKKEHYPTNSNIILNNKKTLQCILKINYLMLWLLPGYMINFNFTRMLFCLFLLDVSVIAQALFILCQHGGRTYESPKSLCLKGGMIMVNIVFLILSEASMTTVITDNTIINFIF